MTAVALTVLHDNRDKGQFGGGRRFIRCEQFPALCPHFLGVSEAIGAGTESPEDLVPLRPLLSSKEMLIIPENAEPVSTHGDERTGNLRRGGRTELVQDTLLPLVNWTSMVHR